MSTWRKSGTGATSAPSVAASTSTSVAAPSPVEPDPRSITGDMLNAELDSIQDAELKRSQRSKVGLGRKRRFLLETIQACGTSRHRIREALDAQEKHDAIVLGLAEHESGHAELKVASRIGQYRPNETFTTHDLAAASAAMTTDLLGQDPVIMVVEDTTCSLCGTGFPMRRLAVESLMACSSCGNSEIYIETNINAHGHDKISDSTSFSYKRSNHFIEWLNAAQGLENTNIPEKVLQDCCMQIRTENITINRVNPKVIRRILKVTGHRKYYENCILICYKLTGVVPMRFTASQEEALKAMFLSIQKPFEEVRIRYVPERRNFLSYSYCLFKFCQLLGLDQFLPTFALLKGRDKLHKQDVIFEHICRILDWEFYPSV